MLAFLTWLAGVRDPFVVVPLIYHVPQSCSLPILIQVAPTITLWLGRLDRQSFAALLLSS